LSGGQRQRVAVARAIVMKAQVLLMDEPLSNLDALLRLQMRAELKRLHEEIKATTIYVTHDQVEALSLGDRIAVMKSGKIVQCDVPMRIYDYPASTFVGGFIGTPPMNFFKGKVVSNAGKPSVMIGDSEIFPSPKVANALSAKIGGDILMGMRPENISLVPSRQENTLMAHVLVVEPLGSHKLLTMKVGTEGAKVSVEPDKVVSSGNDVWLHFDPEKIRWMDAASGDAIQAA
jgi:multiple sugar transport system ATP-binding protein